MAWSRQHAACVLCNLTDQRHFGRGRCKPCYEREYRKRPPATRRGIHHAHARKVARMREQRQQPQE